MMLQCSEQQVGDRESGTALRLMLGDAATEGAEGPQTRPILRRKKRTPASMPPTSVRVGTRQYRSALGGRKQPQGSVQDSRPAESVIPPRRKSPLYRSQAKTPDTHSHAGTGTTKKSRNVWRGYAAAKKEMAP